MRHVGGGRALTREETSASLERMMGDFERAGYGQWAVVEQSTGTFIGRAGILEWPDLGPSGETEIGYLLGRPHWGHGYATEAALASRDHALETLGRLRLISLIDHANERSARVAIKLGMTHEDDVELFGAHGAPVLAGARVARPDGNLVLVVEISRATARPACACRTRRRARP